MKIIIVKDYNQMSITGAELVARTIRANPSLALCLATGHSPEKMYHYLVKMHQEKKLDFSHVKIFHLDEYLGLSPQDTRSYNYYLTKRLLSKINVAPKNICLFNGAESIETIIKKFRAKIQEVKNLDLVILGIGTNGHIAFNEPNNILEKDINVVKLSAQTISDNAKYFNSQSNVPQKAISLGLKPILAAKKIILLASGANKAHAVKAMIQGNLSPLIPASFLQKHQNVTVILDQTAAALIKTNNSENK